ncbi:MAG: bifunctional folylpolyglutamate synthase/dihydrofolate synthase [Oscillospiraceae bacterium]|jgi:dihydrofolate synthase/folylpolyglutamate synthase|nr:bifunctional folylpolyglutamate synthase/dihydrofolate synthase [Oscillospiraceae bacterium]
MNISEALEYLKSIRGSKLGLERTKELLAKLGNPERSLKIVHVAGTNGKGSVCAMMESVLRCAGFKTGMYISPYLDSVNECIRIGGELIPDGALAEFTAEMRSAADTMEDTPTEFEFLTCLALLYFAREECGVVILETGMGGETDATNAIPVPILAVITSVSLDHTAELGNDLGSIAAVKAGIIKKDGRVLVYDDTERVFSRRCEAVGASFAAVDFSRVDDSRISSEGSAFSFAPYGEIRIPLTGMFQIRNAVLAISALELLRDSGFDISDSDIVRGLSKTQWNGRFEKLRDNPAFILDGGHNPDGLKAVTDDIRILYGKPAVFLLGVLADKDVELMARIAAKEAKCVITVTPPNPRALPAEAFAEVFRKLGIRAYAADTIADGVHAAIREAGSDGVVFAAGSLYLSAAVRKIVASC